MGHLLLQVPSSRGPGTQGPCAAHLCSYSAPPQGRGSPPELGWPWAGCLLSWGPREDGLQCPSIPQTLGTWPAGVCCSGLGLQPSHTQLPLCSGEALGPSPGEWLPGP